MLLLIIFIGINLLSNKNMEAMKRTVIVMVACFSALVVMAQTGTEAAFMKWALTPPMGWNSWDCYGSSVEEDEVIENADYMAEHLMEYGWEYVVVDIRWYVENESSTGYNQTDPIYSYDEYGRYTPAVNRFPSAADGVGFKALADYVHSLGLKFGIHIMRGLPKVAAEEKLPVLGTDSITCDMIASNDSACSWLSDNYKVDYSKPGAQEYYNSIFDLYAEWGVDFVKVDDISSPYHTAEIEMVRNAIDQTGRHIVLSLSPGETDVEKAEHVGKHANMWRMVNDFWDNWSQLEYQFEICPKWTPYIAAGNWPDGDILPLGELCIRGGTERWSNFTLDEEYTLMNLWTIVKSPLMFGGNLPDNTAHVDSLLTNERVLRMHHYSQANDELSNVDGCITYTADDPESGDKYVALFNTFDTDFINSQDALYRSGTVSHLTTGYAVNVDVEIPDDAIELVLVVTDGGDDYDCDHSDWINPTVILDDSTTVDLTEQDYLRGTCGWGEIHINQNLDGGTLSINGTEYEKGIATHANSIIIYSLPEGAARLTALAGIDNTGSDQGDEPSVEFMVFGYDPSYREETTASNAGSVTISVDPAKQIATSGFVSHESGNNGMELSADITGAEKLYLVVTNGGDGLDYDHADWGNPILVDSEGNETSLTTLDWDDDPVNGWYDPKINTNNDGNTMYINGEKYSLGFGVNAPSMLTFTLPEGHDYVTFKSIVGYDDDVASSSSGVTMEFRVFIEDPSPSSDQEIHIDLRELGYAEDQLCEITEMWQGESKGEFKNDEFSEVFASHASGLYKVSAVERQTSPDVTLSMDSDTYTDTDTFNISASVSGMSEGYITFYLNDSIVGIMTIESDGSAIYTADLVPAGEYAVKAVYSGTTTYDSSESTTLDLTITETTVPTSLQSISLVTEGVEVTPISGGLLIKSSGDNTVVMPLVTLDGKVIDNIKVGNGKQTVNVRRGVYVVNGQVIAVR